jgi:hypothetical protein
VFSLMSNAALESFSITELPGTISGHANLSINAQDGTSATTS